MRTQRKVVNGRVLFLTEIYEDQCVEVMGCNDHYFGSVSYGENFDRDLEEFLQVCSKKEFDHD